MFIGLKIICLDKKYLSDFNGYYLNNFWDDINSIVFGSNEWIDYPTQKPEELLKRIITTSSNEGNLIADFFCGSGTTLVVAKKLRRRFIGCDNNPKAIEITNNRLNEINVYENILNFT